MLCPFWSTVPGPDTLPAVAVSASVVLLAGAAAAGVGDAAWLLDELELPQPAAASAMMASPAMPTTSLWRV